MMRGIIAAAALVMGITAAWGQEKGVPTADEVLNSVQPLTENSENLKSLVATMTIRFEGKFEYKGHLAYTSPARSFLVTSTPAGGEPVLILSGGTLWCFDPVEQQLSLIRGIEVKPAINLTSDGKGHVNMSVGVATRKEGDEGKPSLEINPAPVFSQINGNPELQRVGNRVRLRGIRKAQEGLDEATIEMEVEPDREFPCRRFTMSAKEQKMPVFELDMEANGEVRDEEFLPPDIEVLRKHLVVKDMDGEKLGVMGTFTYAMNVMWNAVAVRRTPDTAEDRAKTEKELKRKIDWEGAKEWDKKMMAAYREATAHGKNTVHKANETQAPGGKATEELLGRVPNRAILSFGTAATDGSHLTLVTVIGQKATVLADGKVTGEYDAIGDLMMNGNVADGIAFAAKRAGKRFVVHGKEEGPAYDDIGNLALSPDGKRLAYAALKNGQWHPVLDGREGPGCEEIGKIAFSRDGLSTAYAARTGDKWSVLRGGQAGPPFDRIDRLEFSPDGKRLIYVAQRGDKKIAVLDGQAGPECDEIDRFFFSPDGQRLAYVAKKADKWTVVADGKEGPEQEGRIGTVVFSADSKHLTYLGMVGRKRALVVDGQAPTGDDNVRSLEASPDGKHMAYTVENGRKSHLVVDGQPGPEYDLVLMAQFSPQGGHLAYTARNGRQSFAVVDGKAGPAYEWIGRMIFSADEKRIAYDAHDRGDFFVVVDGQAVPAARMVEGVKGTHGIVFSRDGKRVAWVAEGNGWKRAVVDGEPGPEYEEVTGLNFSPEGGHTMHQATKGGKQFIVLDGQAGPEFDAIPSGPVFLKDGTLDYLAKRGDELYRVRQRP